MPLSKKDERDREQAIRAIQLKEAGIITVEEARAMVNLPPIPPVKWESITESVT